MYRQYHSYWMRYDQPDPYGGSYNAADPQSLNRYSYVQNDPVNYVDPSGLNPAGPGTTYSSGILWTIWYGNRADGWEKVHQYFEPYGGDPQETYPGVLGNIKTLKTGDNTSFAKNQERVFDIIHRMAHSRDCNDAFKRAGLPTVDDLIQKGFAIGSRSALTDSGYNKTLGISENERVKFKELV